MILHDEIIHNYVKNEPLDLSQYLIYPKPITTIPDESKRKDIVMELHTQLLPIIQNHKLFNMELLHTLVPNCESVLSSIHVHLLVHAPKPYDIYQVTQQGANHIYIDLLQIADHTPILSRMVYIIQHEISKLCFDKCMRESVIISKDYPLFLNEDAFYNGFSLLLSWNEDISTYNFHHAMYNEHKEKAFGMLYEAIQITDITKQEMLLSYLENASFWDRFTHIASMFYLYDIYVEFGVKGIVEIYQQSANNYIQTIFQL